MEKINDLNEAKNLLEKYLDKKILINKLKKNYFFLRNIVMTNTVN